MTAEKPRRRRRGTTPPFVPAKPKPLPASTPSHPHLIELIDKLLEAGDAFIGATKRVETSLPTQLSVNIEKMVEERRTFERLMTTAAQEEMKRLRSFADLPILLFYGGKGVEELTADELRRALEDWPEKKRWALEVYTSDILLIPADYPPKLRLAEAYDQFAIRAQERLGELSA